MTGTVFVAVEFAPLEGSMSIATLWCRHAIECVSFATALLFAASACEPAGDDGASVAVALRETASDDGAPPGSVPATVPVIAVSADRSPGGLLVAAARAGDVHCVRELLTAGVAPDSDSAGQFAIHGAVASGSVAALHFLVAAGAHLEALDEAGNTALTNAALLGSAAAVALLVAAGADPNAYAEPNSQTPLQAVLSGWARGLSGRNPRFTPKEEERYKAAWLLIQAGGDPQFAPEGHLPPVVLAEGIGGAIGRLYAGKSTNPEQGPH